MSLKDQVIKRFGNKAFSMRPTFYNNEGALRFELGVGDDRLTYLITAFHRLNTVLDDLGFKDQPVGVAASIYTYQSTEEEPASPLHQQLLPLARMIENWNLGKFKKSELVLSSTDENTYYATHLSLTNLNDFSVSRSIFEHLLRDFGGSSNTPFLMLFNLELGIIINPYDDRGMDVFGPNHDLLKKLYNKRNDWLLDYDREQMDAVYKDC